MPAGCARRSGPAPPGEVVQIDSFKVNLGAGRQARQFTAIDCASR
ncbi:hypothetical protein ACFOHS_15060 [Jhaorihella thermophila]